MNQGNFLLFLTKLQVKSLGPYRLFEKSEKSNKSAPGSYASQIYSWIVNSALNPRRCFILTEILKV